VQLGIQSHSILCQLFLQAEPSKALPTLHDQTTADQFHLLLRMLALEDAYRVSEGPATSKSHSPLYRAAKKYCIAAMSTAVGQLIDEPGHHGCLLLKLLMDVVVSGFADQTSRIQPLDALEAAAAVPAVPVIIESTHNYKDNDDWVKVVSIPSSRGLELVFDARTSTELLHDHVTIFADAAKTKRLAGPFSGPAG
jgi:hypothetical protein